MQMPLPEKNFQWMEREQLDNLDILNYVCRGEYGAVLEVYFYIKFNNKLT